jgi:integrase
MSSRVVAKKSAIAKVKQPKTYRARLQDYFVKRAALGLGVPQSASSMDRPYKIAIAEDTGIPRKELSKDHLHEIIMEHAEKHGYDEPTFINKPDHLFDESRSRLYLFRVDFYLSRLEEDGKKVPEDPCHVDTPHWKRIAAESRVPPKAFHGSGLAQQRLFRGIEELGLAVYTDDPKWKIVTYRELFDEGTKCRKEELKGHEGAQQQLYNTRWGLNRFIKFVKKISEDENVKSALDDPIGSEFKEGFEEKVKEIKSSITNAKTRRKFAEDIERWRRYYQIITGMPDLPADFRPALEMAMKRAGTNNVQLAKKSGVEEVTIRVWVEGCATPSRSSLGLIELLENALNLPSQTLVSKLGKYRSIRFQAADYPEFVTVDGKDIRIRNNDRMLPRLRPLLPDDFHLRPMEERKEIIIWLIVNLIGPANEYRKRQREYIRSPYIVKKLPSFVEAEWKEILDFKMSELPPQGMSRNNSWSVSTARMYHKEICRLLGALVLPTEAKNPRMRGHGLDAEAFSLSMLACPDILDWFVRWKALRRCDDGDLAESSEGGLGDNEEAKKKEKYSFHDADAIFCLGALFAPDGGFFPQRPDFAHHLKPIPGYIDETFIESAQNEWNTVCSKAYSSYIKLFESIEKVARQLRDPFEPILPILKSDKPIRALKYFAQSIFDDMPDPATAPLQAAAVMRNHLIVMIMGITALRSKNARRLSYNDDNTGQLHKEGKEWVIEISWTEFKNKESSFFGTPDKKTNYRMVLPDKDCLYYKIEEYVKVHRLTLLDGKHSNFFFINSSKRPLFTKNRLYSLYRNLTMRYLAYNPYRNTGIPGVLPHGPHCVRHIVCTHVLKIRGNEKQAGFSIQDTGRTARKFYGRFVTEDKVRLVDEIIREAWD